MLADGLLVKGAPLRGPKGTAVLNRFRGLLWQWLALGVWGCIPTASSVPLDNASPEGLDSYYYGPPPPPLPEPPASSSSREEQAGAARSVGETRRESHRLRSGPDLSGLDEGLRGSDAGAGDAGVEQVPLDRFVGEYTGTDRVVMHVPGFPEDEQIDDHAQLRVTEGDDDGEVWVTVVDSSDGKDLCKVVATVHGATLRFAPQQECFTAITGGRLTARLVSGRGALRGEELLLKYEIELETADDAPDVVPRDLKGTMDYSFEGERD